MGKEVFCDLCRASVPIAENLQMITIGDEPVAEACFNCASTLKNAIKTKMAKVQAEMMAAKTAAQKPAAPDAAPKPVVPGQNFADRPDIKAVDKAVADEKKV